MLSGKTTQTLTVTNDMVDTTGVFKAEVYQGGKLIGQDRDLQRSEVEDGDGRGQLAHLQPQFLRP